MARVLTSAPAPGEPFVGDVNYVGPQVWRGPDGRDINCWLYCIAEAGFEISGPCKVGIAGSAKKRLSSLQAGNHRRLSLVWSIFLPSRRVALGAERHCLAYLRPLPFGSGRAPRLASEWVSASPPEVFLRTATYLLARDCPIERIK